MPSVKKNFLYSVVLTTANYIFPLITFPYVSRVLGVEAIGLCGFINSVIDYFVLFSTMGLNILGIREIAKVKNDKAELSKTFSSLFFLNFVTTTIMLCVLVVATLVVPKFRENTDLMMIGGAKLMFNFLLIEWFYKGIENFRYITIRSVIVKSLYVVSVLLFVNARQDYVIYFFLCTLMVIINAVINLSYSRNVVKLSYRNANIKLYAKPFFILGIYSLLTSMYTTFNVSFLGFVTSDTQVGYYTTATRIYGLVFSVYTAFSGVMMPRMSSILADGDMNKFKELVNKSYSFLLFLSVPLVVFTFFHSPGIIRVISGEGYEGAILPMRIIMPMMIIIGFELILIEQILMPMRKDKMILINSIAGAVVGVLLNISIVPFWGSVGSAIVKASSEIMVFIMAQYEVYKLMSIGIPWRKLIKYILLYFPLVIIELFLLFYVVNSINSMILSILISGLYFIIVNTYFNKDFDMRLFLKPLIRR